MLKNYFKIAVRNIVRHKGYSFINITGLAIGMACCILIFLWVQDELSYERFHENADQIYRVSQKNSAVTPSPLAAALKEEYPEIIDATRFEGHRKWILSYADTKIEERCALVDPSFFNMFTCKFLSGDAKSALPNLHSIVLTQNTATKLFGDQDPLGKVIKVHERFNLKVTGIIEDLPRNSNFTYKCVIPFEILASLRNDTDKWRPNNYNTYAMLQKDTDYRKVSAKLADIVQRNDPGNNTELHLQPLTSIHLYAPDGGGSINYVYIFSITAIFLLLVACINFINLTTARSSNRAREIGVRKVVGATRSSLMQQFFGESILMAIIAFGTAIVLVEVFLPAFNDLAQKQLSLDLFGNRIIFLGLIGTVLFTGIVSGSYPALFLSSFKPVRVLKGTSVTEKGSTLFRKILVIIQFSLSIFLIIGTYLINDQVEFLQNKDLGYDKEHIVCLPLKSDLYRNLAYISYELENNPNIKGIALTSTLLTGRESTTDRIFWPGKETDDKRSIGIMAVDYNFLDVFNIELLEGRFFSRAFPADINANFVINETAVKNMGLENPIGQRLTYEGKEGTVVGVVKNFHDQSLHHEIGPLVLQVKPGWFDNMNIKINAENMAATMEFLASTINENAPSYFFNYRFLDEAVDNLYLAEKRMGTIFQYFMYQAIFISCLGLFGLVLFMAEQRNKEIGIRKILGASVGSIINLLSKEFLLLICIANLISWPMAWYIMTDWLQGYAYRTNINFGIFILSAFLVILIALVTISIQAIKAALANPVNSLRHE